MLVLRQKSFGKFDKALAEKQGISVEQLRQNRAGFEGTGTVNDRINLRSNGPKSTEEALISSRKHGYSNANVEKVNKKILGEYKNQNLGFNKSANNRTSEVIKEEVNKAKESAKDTIKAAQETRKTNIPAKSVKLERKVKAGLGKKALKLAKNNKGKLIGTTIVGSATAIGAKKLHDKKKSA